jgi:hypothetical protein
MEAWVVPTHIPRACWQSTRQPPARKAFLLLLVLLLLLRQMMLLLLQARLSQFPVLC